MIAGAVSICEQSTLKLISQALRPRTVLSYLILWTIFQVEARKLLSVIPALTVKVIVEGFVRSTAKSLISLTYIAEVKQE